MRTDRVLEQTRETDAAPDTGVFKRLGIGPADEDVYRKLADRLRSETKHVVMLQDFISTPALRDVMTSKDGLA